ncbi:MAG: rod shape-determining protein RodA, partial [bacterium]|nr:rod shape-determining protein RodA [bacterium]
GVLMIYSSIYTDPNLLAGALHWKQLLWSTLGLLVMVSILLVDYHQLTRWAYLLYFLLIVMLVLVFLAGRTVYGAKRWLVFGPVRIQPSELARLFMIIVLARYFGTRESSEPLGFRELIVPFVLVIIPVGLVARQPDLGTALTTFMIAACMVLTVGVRKRVLFSLAGIGLATAPIGWFFLREYQRSRILTVFNPNRDPLGAGYQSLQSKIAIGSGEIWGKGLFQGTQSRLHFLPERHTDFIFSVLSEELGFMGAAFLLFLFLILIYRIFLIGLQAGDKQGTLIAVGVASSIFLYASLNIAMTLGLMPIVGLPLPLVSYGGSAAITFYLSIGLVLNVWMRRKSFTSFSYKREYPFR